PVISTSRPTSGAPPSEASEPNGQTGWLYAIFPQGNPPAGHQARANSCSRDTAAILTGAAGRRVTNVIRPVAIPMYTASTADRPSQGDGPNDRQRKSWIHNRCSR